MYQSRWAPKQSESADTKQAPAANIPTDTAAKPVADPGTKAAVESAVAPTVKATIDPAAEPAIGPTVVPASQDTVKAETRGVSSADPPLPPEPIKTSSLPPSRVDEPYVEPESAQTAGDEEDLFDDVIQADESMRVRSDDDLFSEDFTPAAEPQQVIESAPLEVQPAVQPTEESSVPKRGDGLRGRGRGRGGRGRGDARRNDIYVRPQPTHAAAGETAATASTKDVAENKPATDVPEDTPSKPRKETVPAVRGDRHATGGLKKPKLTEEEMAEKMAQEQIKNASLTAAHERAEADAASFAQREAQAKTIAAQREKEERRDRQQMMGEREKNRARKLKAMGGREWDADKNEDDFQRGGKFDKKGGFAGDQPDYTDGKEYLLVESSPGDRSRGRGRGGRAAGRGRGGASDGQHKPQQAQPKKEDFPSLPTTKKDVVAASDKAISKSMSDPITSWADQVEES